MTPKQMKAIVAAIPMLINPDERRMLALFVFTGMRREEMLGRHRWSIDFNRQNDPSIPPQTARPRQF